MHLCRVLTMQWTIPVLTSLFVCVHITNGIFLNESILTYDISDSGKMVNFIYFEHKLTRNSARLACQALGGDLAKINSPDTLNFMLELAAFNYGPDSFGEDYWTGLIQPSEGQFLWAQDCSPLQFQGFVKAGWAADKMCMKTRKATHIAEKDSCTHQHGFLCEVDTGIDCPLHIRLEADKLGEHNTSDCDTHCMTNVDCIGTVGLNDTTCMLLRRQGTGSHTITLETKFCFNFTKSADTPTGSDVNDIPTYNCPSSSVGNLATTPISGAVASSPLLYPSPTSVPMTSTSIGPIALTPFCLPTTETITSTLTQQVYITQTPIPTSCASQSWPTATTHSLHTASQSATLSPMPSSTQSVTSSTQSVTSSTQSVATSSTQSIAPSSTYVVATSSGVVASSILLNEAYSVAREFEKNLTLNAKTTNAYMRTKVCADDGRMSAKTMGVLGLVCVVVPLSLVVAFDFKVMFTDLRMYENIFKH